jgi:hypothetical protein
MERTELLIIMTPHVVRSQGDMERLKQAEFSRMSWCEADVFDVHGDVYTMSTTMEQSLDQTPWQVIYPDQDPRGKSLPPVQEARPLMQSEVNDPEVVQPASTTLPFGQGSPIAQQDRYTTANVRTASASAPSGINGLQFGENSGFPQVPVVNSNYRGTPTSGVRQR